MSSLIPHRSPPGHLIGRARAVYWLKHFQLLSAPTICCRHNSGWSTRCYQELATRGRQVNDNKAVCDCKLLLKVFERLLQVKRFAICQGTIVLSVCNDGVLLPNVDGSRCQYWYGRRPRPRRNCVRWRPSSRLKGAQQPQRFGPCLLWPNGRPSQQPPSSCSPSNSHWRTVSNTAYIFIVLWVAILTFSPVGNFCVSF